MPRQSSDARPGALQPTAVHGQDAFLASARDPEDNRAAAKPYRLITTAWGRNYIDTLLELTIPALLAPGNLPALASDFRCEFVLVTNRSEYDRIRQSRIFGALKEVCTPLLMPVDDLISPRGGYGMTLSHALHRGFAELGRDMLDYGLGFVNSDFILADGSLRTLAGLVGRGERLIFAPSYCTVEEDVKPILSNKVDRQSGILSLQPREMADLVLAHRHNTIRAKTVNQRLFHIEYMEQFYWLADEHTILGHQLPVSLVYMRPEVVLTELRTIWDYGIVSECCPTTSPCVIGDSDDFLMLELRERSRLSEQLHVGWPTPDYIAHRLSSFTTEDQRRLGRHPLVLHGRDLPANIDEARAKLRAFVDQVYARLGPAHSHIDHKFWRYHYAGLMADSRLHAQGQDRLGQAGALKIAAEVPPKPRYLDIFKNLRLLQLVANLKLEATRALFMRWLLELYDIVVGRGAQVGRLHPNWLDFQTGRKALDRAMWKDAKRVLLVHSGEVRLARGLLDATAGHAVIPAARINEVANLSLWGITGEFDVCIFELQLRNLLDFAKMYQIVRPSLRREARVVGFWLNRPMQNVAERELIEGALQISDVGIVHVHGSWWRVRAFHLWMAASGMVGRSSYGYAAALFLLAVAAPLSMIANLAEKLLGSRNWPNTCTSITLELDVI